MMNFKELTYNDFMHEFELEDFMDRGCPSCGAEAGEDCDEACIPMDVPQPLYAMIEEQMEYVDNLMQMIWVVLEVVQLKK